MDASLYGFLAIMVLCGLDCGFSNNGDLLDMPEFRHLRQKEEKATPPPPPPLRPASRSRSLYSLGDLLNIPALPRKQRLGHDSKYLHMGLGKRRVVSPLSRHSQPAISARTRRGPPALAQNEAVLSPVDVAGLTNALSRLLRADSLEDLRLPPGGRARADGATAQARLWGEDPGSRNRNRRDNEDSGNTLLSRRDFRRGTDPFKYLVGIGK